MTSEVAVMNRLGVALATDSAATTYAGGRAKVYHADKLFMLSHRHPVGVMTYNNSSLQHVPWETIIKMFRSELGTTEYDALEEYAAALIAYLDNNTHLFPVAIQESAYLDLVKTLYEGINKGIKSEVMKLITDSGVDDFAAHKEKAHEVIMRSLEEWRAKEDIAVPTFDPALGGVLAGQFSGEVNGLMAEVFESWELEADAATALQELASLVVSKDVILDESLSGLVVAGYRVP